MDEFHAFAFTHLCFAGAYAKRQFLRYCVEELLPEPDDVFPALPWAEKTKDGTFATTPGTIHQETVGTWCSVAARAALHLAMQTDGTTGSTRDSTAAALMSFLLLSSPQVVRRRNICSNPMLASDYLSSDCVNTCGDQAVPLPFPNMGADSLQDSGNIDTFSPLSDAEVELPDTVC